MNFNKHSELAGMHAFLGASKYHWTNYDDEKLIDTFRNHQAAARGDRLHNLAKLLIMEGVKLPRTASTLNLYVNDAIGYRMTPEQVLFYSPNCFGTADAISFRRNLLRIHDLKTGVTPTSMKQLIVYAAMFCLEYRVKPGEIDMELRIYQSDEVLILHPEVDEVAHVMDKIIRFDKMIEEIKLKG